MNAEIVFGLAFMSQVVTLSVIVPRLILSKYVNHDHENSGQTQSSKFIILNNLVVVVGVFVLALILFLPALARMENRLLIIGFFALIQMFPMLVNQQMIVKEDEFKHATGVKMNVFKFVHPLVVGVACLLFIAYLGNSLINWDGETGREMLKIAIFFITNLFLLVLITITIRRYNRTDQTDDQFADREAALKSIPFLVYISIGISVYFFGKIFLSSYELQEFRPVMMTLFIQLLGFLVYDRIYGLPSKKV